MTEEELEELIADCPILFHMAEHGSWAAIREHGLLSTSALLDLYGVTGTARDVIERQRRSQAVSLSDPNLHRTVIRDQLPMDDLGLRRCLPHYLSPSEWYYLLNQKVFFWLSRERLLTLLNAGTYRNRPHDVLEVSTRSIINAYKETIWLCPINSGCTKPFPHPRDENTFRRIPDYAYAERRRKKKRGARVVELAIDHGVPNICEFITRVSEMQGDRELQVLYPLPLQS